MRQCKDIFGRTIRLTEERYKHLVESHPEMNHQLRKIWKTLAQPFRIVRSNSDMNVLLYYQHFYKTPVGNKIMCVVVKSLQNDYFILTAYFTDAIKHGVILWNEKRK